MSEFAQRIAGLSPAQAQLLQKRLAERRNSGEPIAVIGMSCRFPGAPNVAAYWRLVHDGIDAVREIPPERWNVDEFFDPTGEESGKMSVRRAALVDQFDQFDPQFFGITPREAARMDPQQRLLLEVAWEAMENAGRPADQMAGTRTSVFVGIGGTDYSKVAVTYDDYFQHIDAHIGTGNALSIAANRLSYIFDLHGPSAAIDTACSSSSLAIHLAVESLRRRESDAALAGGVNMILTPETTIAFSKARMLSPAGRCRPFDAAADGYVRGEGCGLVLLKRLADAQRDGDDIMAVLRATSVNQDGRTSGISAPNGQSQQDCIRTALRQAGLSPGEVDYVEAHGTATPLGDPIEMQALAEIFRAADADAIPRETRPSERPCYVSSVKANVGHMETVSGVAGLIKVILMMRHGDIPPQLHFRELNPHVRLDGTRLAIPTEHVPWPRGERPRIAGISSFGFGGTNTHLVVESGPAAPASAEGPDRPLHVLKLAAKTESALKRQAQELAAYIQANPAAVAADLCYSANTGRAEFNHRAAVVAADRTQLGERLAAVGGDAAASGVKQSTVRSLGRPKVAFLFTGQGLQYVGMGRGLFESHPVFRQTLERCDEVLRERWGGRSLLSILYPPAASDSPSAPLHQTEYTQPAMFALAYALAELWRSWGVLPDIVLGHSVGEYPAACVAGAMSLEDGLSLIAERARLMQGVRRHGKMAVIFAPPDQVAATIDDDGRVVIAVVNGPDNTVISGVADDVERLLARFEADGVQAKLLNVSHAFHSPLMDEMLDAFERFAAGLDFQPPPVSLISNLTGRVMTAAPTARYWRDHLRSPVQFAAGMDCVADAQPSLILEIGPTASLLGMGRRCVPTLDAAWLPSLRQGQDDWHVLAASVAEYYVHGGQVDWRGWDQPWHRERMFVPNYPFERSRHWYTLDPSLRRPLLGRAASAAAAAGGVASGHPLLGTRLSNVWSNTLFETTFSAHSPSYLTDHQVQGSPVTPAAVYIEQGLAAAEQLFGPGLHGLGNLVIQQAMFLPEGAPRRVEVSVAPESGGRSTFESFSLPADDDRSNRAWTMHATGQLIHESSAAEDSTGDATGQPRISDWGLWVLSNLQSAIGDSRAAAASVTPADRFYQRMADRGLAYGPAFQVLDDLHRSATDAVARVNLPASVIREAGRYHLHPALGDALMQSMAGAVPLEADGSFSPFTYMPVGVRRVRMIQPIGDVTQPLFTWATRTSEESSPSPERVEGDVCLINAAGDVLVALEGVLAQRLGRAAASAAEQSDRWLYRVTWQSAPLPEPAVPAAGNRTSGAPLAGAWLIFADRRGIGSRLAERLADHGQHALLVEPGTSFQVTGPDSGNGRPHGPVAARIDPLDATHYHQLIDTLFAKSEFHCLGIVHLWSLDIREPDEASDSAAGDAWQSSRSLGCGSALGLIRAATRTAFAPPPPLWFVTSGAQSVADDLPSPRVAVEQSPLLGLGRVAAMEHPELRPRLIDLDPAGRSRQTADPADVLAKELLAGDADGEIAYRGGRRYVARLTRDPSAAAAHGDALSIPSGRAFQLRITKPGSLDALRFVPVDGEPPEVGQVEMEIHAAGLNFSDVLKALGLYPGVKDQVVPLGIEASGVVTAVGPGVTRFRAGDEVFGVVPYAFASHARTAEYALVPKPASIDHDQACTIPITFLTAYHALVRLARLQPGERVLIHAGAGGVGLAAIQIAQHLGAQIFATAGSDQKREFVRGLGVRHVFSSRTLDFADQVLAATDRQGVDVVLNSLPGEAIAKSLSLLRAYGRFLEIGKIDIYQNRMIGLLPFQDNLSYDAIDLDRMLRQRPETIRGLFAEVMEHFAAGHYEPLLLTRFKAEGAIDAFRYMSQRKNIGKVVVAMKGHAPTAEGQGPESSSARTALVRRDGTYLITGGLGGLGLRVAAWLAEQGAATIALLSRRGPSAEGEAALADIRQKGARVVVLQGDVADAASLRTALEQLPPDGPPMRGVVHAAGVLADGVLADMSLDQLDRAMRPKIDGAWNVHVATRGAPLDFFVMFSSVASILGSPGQANYAAGNATLDALAHYRRAHGLPAIAINWGPWAGTGMAADAGRGEAIQSRGIGLITPEQGLELLGKLLRADLTQVAVMDAHWDEMLRLLGTRRPAMLTLVAEEVQQAGGAAPASRVDHAFRNRLLEVDDAARQSLVGDFIRDELARIMGVDAASLDAQQPLSTFGLDSLLALELKNNLESRLDFTLPMARLMEGPSIASLALETVRLVADGGSKGPRGDKAAAAASQQWTPLLALRATGDRLPLVMLPALGGDVRCYAELVQQLDPDRPVYAFRPRGADQELAPHQTMDEMIADYAAALRDLQPSGPYHLAGWSTGGIYAFALAEALQQAGDEVALVALFDTPQPSICDGVDVEDDTRFLCDLVNFANCFAGTNIRLDYGELATLEPSERFRIALAEARRQGTVPAETPEAFIRRLVRVGEANVRVIQGYRPSPLRRSVHLFVPATKGGLAEVAGRDLPDLADNGWRQDIGQEVQLHEVPGDHFSMLSGDGAADIARQLDALVSAHLAGQSR